jgi:NCAIR mutase (PurE)-related protein
VNEENLRDTLARLQAGDTTIDEALARLRGLPFEDLGFAHVDHHRALRQGFPEVIFGAGKTPDQVAAIAQSLHGRSATVLATRCSPEAFQSTQQVLPTARYDEAARIITVAGSQTPRLNGLCGVLCAGTSDLPVAQEAALSLETMGASVLRISDIGVAGLHRLLAHMEEIRSCDVLIVVAGMEGALPSVVGGLVEVPVIAVPTSVGYGAAFGGLAALLGMLNTCASGVAVVNIDNGFGAAAFAASILRGRPHSASSNSASST